MEPQRTQRTQSKNEINNFKFICFFCVLCALCGLFFGCSGIPRQAGGPYGDGVVLEAEGPDAAGAQRKAVEELLGAYLSGPARQQAAAVLEAQVLAKASDYVKTFKIVGSSPARIRGVVLYRKLALDLGRAGLLRPALGAGRPRLYLSVSGDVGPAARALREVLGHKGFAEAGRPDQAEVAAAARAEVRPLGDERLAGWGAFKAELEINLSTPTSGSLSQEAVVVDLSTASAAAAALENAGELAGERIAERLAGYFKERLDVVTEIAGLKNFYETLKLIESVRSVPDVAAVYLDRIDPGRARLHVLVDGSSEELATALAGLKGYSLRPLATEKDYVELEAEAPYGDR